jgi:hypothetical protein
MQPLFGTGCSRSIGGLGENLAVDSIAVFERYLILECGRNKDVTWDVPDGIRSGECLCVGKVFNRPSFFPEIIQFLDRKTVWVIDSRIPLGNAYDFAAVFFREKFRSVIAHIPEALKDNSLSLQPRRES